MVQPPYPTQPIAQLVVSPSMLRQRSSNQNVAYVILMVFGVLVLAGAFTKQSSPWLNVFAAAFGLIIGGIGLAAFLKSRKSPLGPAAGNLVVDPYGVSYQGEPAWPWASLRQVELVPTSVSVRRAGRAIGDRLMNSPGSTGSLTFTLDTGKVEVSLGMYEPAAVAAFLPTFGQVLAANRVPFVTH